MRKTCESLADRPAPPKGADGFILVFTMLMTLSISVVGIAMMLDAKQSRANSFNYKHKLESFYASDGMMTLLADEVLNGRDTVYTRGGKRGFIKGVIWKTSGGMDVKSFRNMAKSGAGGGMTIQSFTLGSSFRNQGCNGDVNYKDDYGIYWKGFIYPPVSGYYTFFVHGDDQTEFYLSTDESPDHLSMSPLAYNYSYMDQNLWPTQSNQPSGSDFKTVSEPQLLKADKRYYFEFFHKEYSGNDFGQVGWSGPDWLTEKPMPGNRLSTYDSLGDGAATDESKVGGFPVRYNVQPVGQDVFSLFTEGYRVGYDGDTLTRTPLFQKISLKAPNGVPPDTMWARVVYYDYRSDRSNPEFENASGHTAGPGMVVPDKMRMTTVGAPYFGMDSIAKPIGTGDMSNVHWSCALDRWFDPWVAGNPANLLVPRDTPGAGNDCQMVATTIDTLFKNFVIRDSLAFIHQADIGTNSYRFSREGGWEDSGFFPIDTRGFGKESLPRNFSFCMEMHSKFLLVPGLVFDFTGDDDVWMFVDSKLALDLGGVHGSQTGSVYFDDLGLANDLMHRMDFFFCERHTWASHIKITTNLPMGESKGKVSKNWRHDYGNLD